MYDVTAKLFMIKKTLIFFFFCIASTSFSQVPLLDSVTLSNYQEYTDLREALTEPDNVIKLSLRKKKYKSFPKEIYQFKNLQYLDLSKNDLKELPDSIVSFQ